MYQDVTKTCRAFLWLVSNSFSLEKCWLKPILVGRLNRPGFMVYGGTIRPGSCASAPQLDIVSAFQSYGKYLQDGRTDKAEKERFDTIRHACPGPGACGGMYTANTMASAAEALGMTLPGSSSFPAEYPEKLAECDSAGAAMRNLLEKNILPRDIMTRAAFENAMVRIIFLINAIPDSERMSGPDHDSRRLNKCRSASYCHCKVRRNRVDNR